MARFIALMLVIGFAVFAQQPAQAFAPCNTNGSTQGADSTEGATSSDGTTLGVGGCNDVAPTTPPSISAPSSSTTGSYTVSWGASTGSGTIIYKLYESLNSGSYALVSSSSSLSSALSGKPNGSYRYQVEACAFGGGPCSSRRTAANTTVVTLPAPMPATPARPTASSVSAGGQFTISWQAVTHATRYILMEQINGGAWSSLSTTSLSKAYTKSDGNYFYKVVACNGNAPCSAESGAVNVSIVSPPTTVPVFTSNQTQNFYQASSTLKVSWQAVSGATFYQLERSNGAGWVAEPNIYATLKDYPNYAQGTYTFRIKACNTAGCTANWSSNHVISFLQISNVAGEPRQRAAVTLTVLGGMGQFINVEIDGAQVLNQEETRTFTRTLSNGVHQVKAALCTRDESTGGNNQIICDDYGMPFQVEVVPAPGAPSSITRSGNADYDGEVLLNWGVASGEVHKYEVSRKLNGAAAVVQIPGPGLNRSLAFSNLENGRYEFFVKACNTIAGNTLCSADVGTTSEAVKNLKTLIPEWDKANYGIYEGNFNSNPGDETLLLGHKDIILLHGDIITPIAIFPKVPNAVVSWSAAGVASYSEFQFDADPDNYAVRIGSFDSDSYDEIFLQGKSKGSTSYSLNSNGALIQTIPNQFLRLDWSAATYTADIQSNGVNLVNLVSSAENNFAVTNDSGAITHLTKPITQPTIAGETPRFINKGQTFSFVPSTTASTGSLTFSLTGQPSWMTINASSGNINQVIPVSSGNESYTVKVIIKENKTHTIENSMSFKLDVLEAFSIANTEYDVYVAANGDVYLKAKNGSGYFKVQRDGDDQWIAKITLAEFNASGAVLNADYQVAFNDYNNDGQTDLVIYSVTDPELVSYAIGSIDSTEHVVVVGSAIEFYLADTPLIEPTVPENENVGAVNGSAGVSGGAASYSIPMTMPPGRNGMQPSVSINYSSRSGNGLVGVGWGLSAGSSISRCSATYEQDGFTSGVLMNSSTDRLCLDGQRLMVVNGTYGVSGAEYRTEIDSFVTVKQIGSINGTDTTFTVEDNSGRIKYYGVNGVYGAEVNPVGFSELALSWMISKETITNGKNAIHYQYLADNTKGEVVLTSIYYTGENDQRGNREVRFEYRNDRDDASSSYTAGGLTRQTKLLSAIRSFYGTQQVTSLTLNYSTNVNSAIAIEPSAASGRAILRSVTSCGTTDNDCLPPTEFTWLEAETQYQVERLASSTGDIYPGPSHNLPFTLPHGDYNGDGVRDWPNQYVNAEGESTPHSVELNTCTFDSLVTHDRQCIDVDYDLNGTTDTWKTENGVLKIGLMVNKVLVWKNTNIPMGTSDLIVNAADYNGDGWTDIVVRRLDNAELTFSFYPNTKNLNGLFVSNQKQVIYLQDVDINGKTYASLNFVGDMDGNGLPDIVVNYTDSDYVRPFAGTLKLTKLNGSTLSFTDDVDIDFFKGEFSSFAMFFDINADGLQDLIGWDGTISDSGSRQLKYKLNMGNGYFGAMTDMGGDELVTRRITHYIAKENGDVNFQYVPKFIDSFRVMDVDGDGTSELLMPSNDPNDMLIEGCAYHKPNYNSNYVARCGASVYTEFDSQPSQNADTLKTSLAAKYDFSIYKYVAMHFVEDSSGNFSAQIKPTPIVGGATHTQVVDAYGKGLPDVIFNYGCSRDTFDDELTPDCTTSPGPGYTGSVMQGLVKNHIYQNRNFGSATSTSSTSDYRPRDMLVRVVNGLQVENQWQYLPLSSGQVDNLYAINAAEAASDGDNQFAFASSMYVVTEFKQSNGLISATENLNSTHYKYRSAVYNAGGRGFQGFRSVIVDSPSQVDSSGNITSSTRTVTNFHQEFPLAGQVKSSYSCIAGTDYTCESAALSKSETGYAITTTANSDVYWSFPAKTVSQTFDLGSYATPLSTSISYVGLTDPGTISPNMIVSSAAYNSYGNILKSVQKSDAGFGESEQITEKVYDESDPSWISLTSSTVTTKALNTTWPVYDANLDLDKKVRQVFTWTTHRKPDVVTTSVISGGGKSSVVDTDYNTYGLPTKVTISSSGEIDRYVTTTHTNAGDVAETDGYFVYSTTNQKNHASITKTDPKFGIPIEVVNANGQKAVSVIDNLGRVESVKAAGAPTAYTRYAACDSCSVPNAVMTVSNFRAGAPVSVTYQDQLGRPLATATQAFESSYQVVQKVTYNRLGQKLFESVPMNLTDVSGSITTGTNYVTYDEIGRLKEKHTDNYTVNGLTVEYTYQGYETSIEANGLIMKRQHSGSGQLMQTTDAYNGLTKYAYDGQGNPIVLQDANGNAITTTYNALGQKLWVNDPNMGRKDFTYTGFAQVDTEQDAKGNLLDYNYDSLGRLETRVLNGAVDASYTFDSCEYGLGLLCIESGGSKVRTFEYDELSRPAKTTDTIDGESFITRSLFDGNYGRMKALTYPKTGLIVSYDYQSDGYMSALKNAATNYVYQQVTSMSPRGQIIAANSINGLMNTNTQYDDATGQMTSIIASTVSGSQRHHLSYTYDDFDNLLEQFVQTTNGVNQIETSTESFDYDNLHRLKWNITTQGQTSNQYDYVYDAVGNLTSNTNFASSYTYGSVNRTSSNGYAGPNAVRSLAGHSGVYSYDMNGNMTSGGGKTITYNAYNKPVSISKSGIVSTFSYGANLMRYKQVKSGGPGGLETTLYVDKLFEKITQGNKTEYKNYIGDVAVFTRTIQNSTTTDKLGFIHRDRLGSVVTVLDEQGVIRDFKSYDPFGRPRTGNMQDVASSTLKDVLAQSAIPGGQLYTNRGFTDHEHLDDAELIHMNGRVYDYNLGRFLSVDPIIQSPGNSQSMNPYSYIMNNPLAGTDPSGYAAEEVTKKVKVVSPRRIGSLTQRKSTVTVTGKSDGNGGATVTVSGSNGAAVKQVAGTVAGKMSGAGLSVSSSSTDIGGQESVAQKQNSPGVGGNEGSFNQGSRDTALHTESDWQCGELTCDVNHDPVPPGTELKAKDQGLGLVIGKDGKLTGNIIWGCTTSEMADCTSAIQAFDELISENSKFLNITNSLVDYESNPKVKTTAAMLFYANDETTEGGYWDGARKMMRVNLATVNKAIYKHEFGHALGLFHKENVTKNFMSYYGQRHGGNVTDRSNKLTQVQKYELTQAHENIGGGWWPF